MNKLPELKTVGSAIVQSEEPTQLPADKVRLFVKVLLEVLDEQQKRIVELERNKPRGGGIGG